VDDKVLINLLVELAGLEEEWAAAAHTVVHHTARERDLRRLQAEYEEDASRAQVGDQGAHVRLRGKENEIRATETALTLKRDQIIGVSDSRQYGALQKEITGLEQKLSQLEDEALTLLAEVETAGAGCDEAEADREAQALRGQAEITRLDSETERATVAQTELTAAIDRCLSMLPETVKRQVLRLRQNGGPAVVRVKSGVCGGCFGQLPAQQAIDAEKGRAVVRCAGCGRFVVHHVWR